MSTVTKNKTFSGPVVHPSWKYPDKKSNEVNLADLLELYDFTQDEEDNQMAHIVLLELVVDRYWRGKLINYV